MRYSRRTLLASATTIGLTGRMVAEETDESAPGLYGEGRYDYGRYYGLTATDSGSGGE